MSNRIDLRKANLRPRPLSVLEMDAYCVYVDRLLEQSIACCL
jgi:hypothetical protein